MAEGLLRQALPGRRIRSAGLRAVVGAPADPHAVQLMRERGVDISGHRGLLIDAPDIAEADMVLTMDLAQQRELEVAFVSAKGKVFRLGEAGAYDIPDPYRQGEAAFREALKLMARGVDDYARRLCQLQGAGGSARPQSRIIDTTTEFR
jgi:protein-tyrosine phosphatase